MQNPAVTDFTCVAIVAYYSTIKPKFHLAPHVTSCLDTTRHVRRVEPMHFGCVELVEPLLDTLVSTRSTRRTCCAASRRNVKSRVEFGLNSFQRVR